MAEANTTNLGENMMTNVWTAKRAGSLIRLAMCVVMAALVAGLYGCSGCDDDEARVKKMRTPRPKETLLTKVKKAKGSRDLDEIRHVLARGADPDGGEEGQRKGTPLYWAARMGKTGATRLLAAKGAELDRVNESVGGTALMGAAMYRSKGAVEVLLKAGADPNVKTKFGRTALHAAARGGDPEIVSTLLAAGAHVKNFECVVRRVDRPCAGGTMRS